MNYDFVKNIADIALKDFSLSDEEKDKLIDITLNTISVKTNIFKKRCSFKLDKDYETLNFNELSKNVFETEIQDYGTLLYDI